MSLTLCHYYIVAKLTFTKNLMVNELKQEGMVASLLLKKCYINTMDIITLFSIKSFVSIKPSLIYNFVIIKKEAPSDF